jgi:hypothetical protein
MTDQVFLYCRVPVADAPGCTAACRLIVQPEILKFQLAPPGVLQVTLNPATLAGKGGIIGREMTSKFGLKVARYFYGPLHAANLLNGTRFLLSLRRKAC